LNYIHAFIYRSLAEKANIFPNPLCLPHSPFKKQAIPIALLQLPIFKKLVKLEKKGTAKGTYHAFNDD
jgi:hypothetical protein